MKRIFFVYLLIFSTLSLSAQFYDIGQEPATVKWSTIKSKNFQLIFPDHYTPHAESTIKLFEKWRLPVSASLKVIPPKTPVILHTGNINSNAYSIWAPRRLEFLTIPPQDSYSQPWIDQLVLHEYRHIAQISSVNQGFTKALGVLFGQTAAPFMIGAFVPSWFMEGDAVAIETALSNTGRGREADFAAPLRAQLKEKGAYSYSKAYLGSYKDFVPNDYILGYHIVSVARSAYGSDIWASALNYTGRQPYRLNPFSKGIKVVSGKKKVGLYKEAMSKLDSTWESRNSKQTNLKKVIVPSADIYTNYYHPYSTTNGIVSLKSSLSEVAHFVLIDSTGIERKLHTPGNLFQDEISFNNEWISYVERRPHPRWETHSYANIMLLNPSTSEVRKIVTRQRLFSPAVSPDNKSIVTAEVTETGNYFLTFFDLEGTLTAQVPSPDNLFISSPSWSHDGNRVVMIVTGHRGKQIIMYDLNTKLFNQLTQFMSEQISHPRLVGNILFFNMDVNERSEVCSMDLNSGEIIQLTSSIYGTKHPSFNENTVLLSEYTADGYRISQMSFESSINKPVIAGSANSWPLADTLTQQESQITSNTSTTESYTVEPYSKIANLFKFHSWAPIYINVDDQSFNPGAIIMSQNLLSTLFLTAGYEYNLDEQTGRYKISASYRGWFPEIYTSVSSGKRAGTYVRDGISRDFTWKETLFDLGLVQRLRRFNGPYSQGVVLALTHQLTNNQHNLSTPHNFINGMMGALSSRIYAYTFHKSAPRDIATPSGISIDLRYKSSIYGDYRSGDLYSAQLRMYIRGLFVNHSTQVYAAWQNSNTSEQGYYFTRDITIPSGYDDKTPSKLIRIRPSYSLPLAYPDYNLGTFFYLKRARGSVFYDFATDLSNSKNYFTSVGVDLIADYHLLSLPAPLSTGVRIAMLPASGNWHASLIFSFDLSVY